MPIYNDSNVQKMQKKIVELSQWQDMFLDLRNQGAKWKPEQFGTLTIFQFFENIILTSAYAQV